MPHKEKLVPVNPLDLASGVETETEEPIETVAELIATLKNYRETDRELYLIHVTLSLDAIADLAIRLQALTEDPHKLTARLDKYRRRFDTDKPFPYLVAGQLTQLGTPSGPKAKEDAEKMLMVLKCYRTRGKISPEEIGTKENEILTSELLTAAMELAAGADEEGSVTEQLGDFFGLIERGLVLRLDETGQLGVTLPQALLTVLKGLKHQKSGEILTDWIYQQISGQHPEYCINFLRVLAQLTAFLDNEAYVRLYAPGGTGKIPLLPFYSFHSGIKRATQYLSRLQGTENFVKSLKEIEGIITLRFYAIIKGPFNGAVSALAAEALAPSPVDLAFNFVEWAEQIENGSSPQEKARVGFMMLRQSGTSKAMDFCKIVGELDPELGRAIVKEAVRTGLVTDAGGSLTKEMMGETLQALKENPWRDAAEIDFTKIIDPEADLLEIYFGPGTYGPFHPGHDYFVRKTLAYINYRGQLDPPESRIQRLILLAPIISTKGVPGYPKDWASVGSIAARVGTIMISLADTDRKTVFITTALQPEPQRAMSIAKSIKHTLGALKAKIQADFEAANKVVGFDIEGILFIGADEYGWHKTQEGLALTDNQPGKIRKTRCLCVGRYGYLVDLILNADDLARLTLTEGLILTPGVSGGSTELIKKLHQGDTSQFFITTVPLIMKYWNQDAIQRRKQFGIRKEKTLSVSEIYQNFITEYQGLLKQQSLI